MNKKDIIIAAMLINSILLLGIFAFSKKNAPRPTPVSFPKVATTIAIPAAKPKVTKLVVTAKKEVKKSVSKIESVKKIAEKKHVASKTVYYTVQSGDNPWTIARKNHIKVDDLLKLNNLNKQSAKKLRPGDKLRIK